MGKNELTLKEIDLLFRNIGNSLFWLSLTGGEPFLRNDLVDIVSSAIMHSDNLSLISLNTNGLATDKILSDVSRIVSENSSRNFFVIVSLDGTKDIHDKLRGISNAYEKTENTISKLIELSKKYKNLSVSAETTISRYNIYNIMKLFDSELYKKCPISFTFAHKSEYYMNESSSVEITKDYTPIIDELTKKIKIRRYVDFPMKIFYRLAKMYFKDNKQVLPCYSSYASIFLDPYGNTKPCITMDSIGNLREYNFDLKKILKDNKFRDVRKEIKRGNCPNCWTPCEALQTIMQNFPIAIVKSIFNGD